MEGQTMNIRHPIIPWLAACGVLCVLATPVWAQEPDAEASPAEAELTSDNPAVDAILATQPTTPSECIQAAKILTDLGDPDMAKRFVKKVVDANLKPDQLAELGEEFSASLFFELARHEKLLPEAKELADAVVQALNDKLKESERIAGLIEQLQASSADIRGQAMLGLQDAREAAIGPLLAVLADPARTIEYANVRTVLASLGRLAQEPLLAVIDGADPKLTVQAILALAEMNQPKLAIYFVGPCLSEKSDAEVRAAAAAALKRLTGSVPNRSEAARQLSDVAKLYFARKQPTEGEADGKVLLWRWNEAKRRCVASQGTLDEASRETAARLARDAHSLATDDREIRLLYLATMLDAAAYTKGLDRPLDDKSPAIIEARPFGVKAINEVLEFAIVHQHPAAAAAAARLLGEVGHADELLYQGDKPAPLVRAVQQPDRRLSMAALGAIVRLQPTRPFPGSSYVPGGLAFFAGSRGARHALVAGPNMERIRDLAGLLTTAGFQIDTATNGKDLLRMAAQSPDDEVAFIDVSMSRPEAGLLLQELRREPRTALLPVGLIARDGYLEQANRVADADPMSKAFAQPQDAQAIRWQLDQLAALTAQEAVDFKTRQQQAAAALDLLAELSRTSTKLYDLRRSQDAVIVALVNPKLSVKAAAVLANMNSPESQRALVDLASRLVQPLEVRQAAAKAFRENTQKHGILLTTDEIREQYRRYNESEKQDAASQKVLSLILDCLEVRTKPTK
jgi:CheY-like chemotaxis protein